MQTFFVIMLLVAAWSIAVVAPPPEYRVSAAAGPRGGLLSPDAEPWKAAMAVSWGPEPYGTTFRALWNKEGLFVRFDASDDHPWHTMTRHDEHLWEEEVVEVFLDIDRSGRDYAELEISPANVVCDVRMIQPWPDKKQDFAWNVEGLETRVVKVPKAGGQEDWIALAFLPWTAFRSLPGAQSISLPPRAGDRWRFNVFRIKRPGGPAAPERGAVQVAWSPPSEPSFHVPAAFRDFVFD